MVTFLTSSPSGPLGEPNDDRLLDEKNGFVWNLKRYWKPKMKGLMISASPDSYEMNDEMTEFFTDAFAHSGVPVTEFKLWDYRSQDISAETLKQCDVVMLAGGHVPTQNAFFHQIHLREMMEQYDGIVVGVSAGTMNSADVVYAQPELPGESIDPEYQRYLRGLGLTQIMVLPHYQMVKDSMKDGKRLFEDITFKDSYGKAFIALTDGSYILITKEESRIFGEAYQISDGRCTLICEDGQSIQVR